MTSPRREAYPALTMRILASFLVTAVLFLPASVPAARADLAPSVPELVSRPLQDDLFKTTVHRLENGLTVYLSPSHQEPRVSAWIAFRVGGKHDPSDSTGMAHYLEHMLFKGSQRMGTLDYAEERVHLDRILELYEKLFETKDPEKRKEVYAEIDAENVKAYDYAVPGEFGNVYDELGFQGLNAFTGPEYVTYICSFPSNRAETWGKVESDRFARPVFRLFQTEIETVYEEKNMSMDRPWTVINEALAKKLFKEHPYGQQTILGSIEHLKNPSLKKMYDFYAAYYVPNNAAVCLAGDFDRDKMLALVRKYFEPWEPKPLAEPKKWGLPKPSGVERVEVRYESEETVRIAWLLPHNRHGDAYALQMMGMLMDNGRTGIIDLDLNQAQKVKSAGGYVFLSNDAGQFQTSAVPKKGQTLEEAEKLLLECVEKLKAGEFKDEDLAGALTAHEVWRKRRVEDNQERVATMAYSFQEFREWEETANEIERLRKVTRDDVRRVARKHLGGDYVVAYRRDAKPEIPKMSKPEFTKIDLDPTRRSEFARQVLADRVRAIEPKWVVEGRDYVLTKHQWGEMYSTKNPVNDLFSVHFGFYFGHMHDRKLASAISLLELSGAGDLTTAEFQRKLYGLGASLGYGSDERWVYITLTGIDKNLEPSLKLLFEHFNSPNVPADALAKMVEIEIGAHADNKKNPGFVHDALGEYAQRGKESQVLADLNDDELRALRQDDLVALVRRVLDFKRHVVYVGNRSPRELAALLVDGRKEYAEPPASKTIHYVKVGRPRVLFVHRDMIQSQVGIFSGDEIFNPDEFVNYEFFGGYIGGGLIFDEVREARALAYSAWGGYSQGHWKEDQNAIAGGVSTQADKTIEATKVLRDLMRSPPLEDKRYTKTAEAIELGYRTGHLGFRDIGFEAMRWKERGIAGGDPRPERFRKAKRYTMDDLAAFAKRFHDRPLTIYVLGNRDRVDLAALKELGDFQELKLEDIFPY